MNSKVCIFKDHVNVLIILSLQMFSKPIAEVLLNQDFFNGTDLVVVKLVHLVNQSLGIGNYLRAEILHRACIDPLISVRPTLYFKH